MLQLSVDKSGEEITQQCTEAVGASSWCQGNGDWMQMGTWARLGPGCGEGSLLMPRCCGAPSGAV